MQLINILLLSLFFFSNTVLCSPLIFKVNKDISTNNLIELGSFDATKYKQIRIGVKFVSAKSDFIENNPSYNQLISKSAELNAKLSKLRMTLNEKHPEIILTRNEIDKTNNEIANLVKLQKEESNQTIEIFGIEGNDEILLYSSDKKNESFSIVLDSPPSKIIIKAKGEGKYSLYVWAS